MSQINSVAVRNEKPQVETVISTQGKAKTNNNPNSTTRPICSKCGSPMLSNWDYVDGRAYMAFLDCSNKECGYSRAA